MNLNAWHFVCPLTFLLLFAHSCNPGPANTGKQPHSPAGEYSNLPTLHKGADDRVYLSWVEQKPNSSASLWFAVWDNDRWTEKKKIAVGDDWFLNWADFPSIVANEEGRLLAYFLQKSGNVKFAYDIMLTTSDDAGNSWTKPFVAHNDGTATEHGFVSAIPLSDGEFRIAWLDGRHTMDHNGHEDDTLKAMNVWSAVISDNNEIIESKTVDNRVCDCCQTDIIKTPAKTIIFYRDRSGNEIRDISHSSFDGISWSSPQNLHTDEWEITGCPVNGPQADAIDDNIAVAWFTMAGGTAKVQAKFSTDGGSSFTKPIRVDDGDPLGRIGVTSIDENYAVVSWLELTKDAAEIKVRLISRNGGQYKSFTKATIDSGRGSGFPQIASIENQVFLAWTIGDSIPRIKTDRFPVISLREKL